MMDIPLFPELFQVSEIEISYHNHTPFADRIKISNTSTALDIFNSTWDRNKIELVEECKILLMNITGHCLGIINLSTGSANRCPFDIRIVMAATIKANASAIILAHNHPGGSLTPSNDDISLTKTLVKAAKLLGIAIIDHLILTKHGYFSFSQNKILPR